MAELTTRVDHQPTTTPVLVGWGALWSAIALNVSQVFVLDSTNGLREPALLPLAAAGFLAELWLFGRAVRCLSPVIAYAAYGTTPAVVTVLSVAFFGEALTVTKLAGVATVTVGVVLLATDRSPTSRVGCARHRRRSVTAGSHRVLHHGDMFTREVKARGQYRTRGHARDRA